MLIKCLVFPYENANMEFANVVLRIGTVMSSDSLAIRAWVYAKTFIQSSKFASQVAKALNTL